MFYIHNEIFGIYEQIILKNSVSNEFAGIIPGMGANLNQLVLYNGQKLCSILDGAENYKDFIDEYMPKFAGLKLFPFPNRTAGASYLYNKRKYHLNANDQYPLNNALHGLVYNSSFFIMNKFESKEYAAVTIAFQSFKDFRGYPFKFRLEVTYKLSRIGLSVTTRAKNIGKKTMPMGDGWHPYFYTGTKTDKLILKIPASHYLETNHQLIPTGKLQQMVDFMEPNLIGKKELNHCFAIPRSLNIAKTIIQDEEKNIKIVIWQESQFEKYRYVQYYTPPNRKGLAIEPMSCAPDALNNHLGLIELEPNQEKEFTYGIQLEIN